MSLPLKIEDVLHGQSVERERLEFKEGWNPLEVLHALCAFANDFHNLGGGYVVVGVGEQDGRPVLPPTGLNAAALDGYQKKIIELGHRLQPPYVPLAEPCVVEGRHVLFIRAQGGQNRPYKAPLDLAKGCRDYAYFIRRNSTTIQAKGDDLNELLSLAANVPFDDRLNQRATVEDLKLNLIQEHLSRIGSDLAAETTALDFTDLCWKMNIVGGSREACYPLNVGLMFFNPQPERFFPQTQIDVVQFPEGTGGDRIIEKTFRGPLGKQITEALAYIENQILATATLKEPLRAEARRVWNFPYAAIEELLANAVYHRSYETREPIEVRIEPDRLTITSYPGPDRSISLSDLQAGRLIARRYRNRRIGEFLKELELTEGRGTGIPKVVRAMRDNGSPAPQFQTNDDRDYFTSILPIHAAFEDVKAQGGGDLDGDLGGNLDGDLDGQGGPRPSKSPSKSPLEEKESAFLDFCRVPRSRAAIQEAIGISNVSHFRLRYLLPLLERGLLEMTIPGSPTSRLQQYRTTPKGLAWLAEDSD